MRRLIWGAIQCEVELDTIITVSRLLFVQSSKCFQSIDHWCQVSKFILTAVVCSPALLYDFEASYVGCLVGNHSFNSIHTCSTTSYNFAMIFFNDSGAILSGISEFFPPKTKHFHQKNNLKELANAYLVSENDLKQWFSRWAQSPLGGDKDRNSTKGWKRSTTNRSLS